ncbi:glycosyltransferase family 4 protein [Ferruginibacter albus]|uniref:glycosyltransferase family 4 protein n=1 Tax=Ferruginibacter albus TaxID=2875540 RepID=UPI001CC747F9|nr:glycosyltransferase family 1 protein [Ferruginibacter albus]UAY52235.1 glycosyltransferase family 4 protein [Ferruginibacter albus]
MNILYFIPTLSQESGGIRQYAIALLETLQEDHSGNQYYILYNTSDAFITACINNCDHFHGIPATAITEKTYQKVFRIATKNINLALEKSKKSFRIRQYSHINKICKKYKIDIIHEPAQTIPLASNVKIICTMHDVQELIFPENFTPEQRIGRAVAFWNALSVSDKIIVSYEHVKKDIIKYFRIPQEKIMVCLLSMKNLWFMKYRGSVLKNIADLYLPKKFLLYPANTWQHKNHIKLLEAIAYLRDEKGVTISLVCTGNKTVFFDHAIMPVLKKLDLDNNVSFLGIVDDETLYAIYKSAEAVVVPTMYEAGSFPLMESIIMEIPVVCSNVTSLPETIGDSRFTFDPSNVEDIAEKCYKIYADTEYRQHNIANSKLHADKILHTDALKKIVNMYANL